MTAFFIRTAVPGIKPYTTGPYFGASAQEVLDAAARECGFADHAVACEHFGYPASSITCTASEWAPVPVQPAYLDV